MKNTTLIIILIFCLGSCQGQKKESLTKNNITTILERQLEYGSPTFDNPYKYEKEDLEVIFPTTKKILDSSDFKFPSSIEFNDKIKKIFSRTIDLKLDSKYLYINFLDKCNRTFVYFLNNTFAYFGIYVIKNDNYITDSYAIPQIIDYKKDFSISLEYEKTLSIFYNDEHGQQVEKRLWKDRKNLIFDRQNNIQTLVNRNKYLFNDNKSSLVWLKTHDAFFLESLIKTFGYVQDKDLLKWVLEKNLLKNGEDDVEEFAKILWTRNCDGKIEVHKEVFDFMLTQNEIEREKYAASLLLFRDYYKNTGKDLSFSELTKIRAIVCYYGTKMSDNYFYSFFPYLHSEKYAEEFKKNNYYDISDFKELYEDAKYGGINEPY